MLRRSMAFLLNITASAFASALVSVFVMGSSISAAILKIAIFSLGLGVVLTVALEQERVLVFNWWWHRFWVELELGKRYYGELQRKSGKTSLEVFKNFPKKSYIEINFNNQRSDLIDFFQEKISANKHKPLVISGNAGSGKSYAIIQAAYCLIKKASWKFAFFSPLPVILFADEYSGNLVELIEKNLMYFTTGKDGKLLSQGTDQLMRMGKFLIIIDGVEQVSENLRQDLMNEMKQFINSPVYKKNQFIFTCRTGYVDSYFDIKNFSYEIFETQPLSDEAVSIFINSYKEKEKDIQIISQQLNQQSILDDNGLGRSPYWLRLMVAENIFEKNPALVLDKAINQLLRDERSKTGKKTTWRKIEPEETQIFQTRRILTFLAYELVSRGSYAFDYRDACQFIESKIEKERFREIACDDILGFAQDAQIIDEITFDMAGKKSPVRFRHSLLLDFLAACEFIINTEIVTQDVVDNILKNTNRWWATLVMLGKLSETNRDTQARRLLINELTKHENLNSVLVRFCLLDHISHLFDEEAMTKIKGVFYEELLHGDLGEEKLSLLWRTASFLPDDFVDLVERIKVDSENEKNIRVFSNYLVQQESRSGHSTPLLYCLTSQSAWGILAKQSDKTLITFRDVVEDSCVNQSQYTFPILLELLKIPGVSHIDFILKVLGRIKNESAVGAILELMQNNLGVPEPTDALSREFNDTLQFGRLTNCIDALGEIGSPKAIPILLTVLKAKSDLANVLKIHVQAAIAKTGEQGAQTLLELVQKEESIVVWMGSQIPSLLASIGESALPHLRNGVNHYNSSVQIASLKAIGLLKDAESIQVVTKRVGDADIWVRKNAIDALSMIGTKEAVVALIDASDREIKMNGNFFDKRKGERQVVANLWIAEALAAHCGTYFDLLFNQLDNPNILVQGCVIKAFGISGDSRVLPKIKQIYENTSDIILKQTIIEALGDIKTKDAKLMLFDIFKESQKNHLLFTQNIISIARHGEKFAIDGLLKMVAEERGFDIDYRKRAAYALALMKNQDAVLAINKLIEEMSNSSDKNKARHIKELGGYLDIINPKIDPLLEEMLKDEI